MFQQRVLRRGTLGTSLTSAVFKQKLERIIGCKRAQ